MNTNLFRNIIIAIVAVVPFSLGLGSCHSIEKWDNDIYGNFDALWTILDQHYCFFEEKGVDWDEVGRRYRSAIDPEWDLEEFFDHCAAMIDELRDGHTNLQSWFDVSYYRKWWTEYPQNFDLRLIQEHYLNFNYHSGGGIIYKLLEDCNVGYMYYSSFSASVGEAFLDTMMLSMKDADGLVIDIRDNGGGDMTNVEKLVARFIDERLLAGYITHKTGPGHSDFSEPYAFYYEPNMQHVRWLKPIIILTNRSTFSAANTFVSVMKGLPYVAVIGDKSGGGSGMPFSSEIPIGWGIRFSGSPVYDAQMKLTEFGVEPTEGGKINMDREAAEGGHDTILDFAIEVLNRVTEENSGNSTKACMMSLAK